MYKKIKGDFKLCGQKKGTLSDSALCLVSIDSPESVKFTIVCQFIRVPDFAVVLLLHPRPLV